MEQGVGTPNSRLPGWTMLIFMRVISWEPKNKGVEALKSQLVVLRDHMPAYQKSG